MIITINTEENDDDLIEILNNNLVFFEVSGDTLVDTMKEECWIANRDKFTLEQIEEAFKSIKQ